MEISLIKIILFYFTPIFLLYFSYCSQSYHNIPLLFKFTTGVNSFVGGGFFKEYAFHTVFTTEKWDFESKSSKKTLVHI